MTEERRRLDEATRRTAHWRRWGPYLSERQWGTVREDYSPGGTAWEYFPHEHARSRAYRWGEDGLAGISDNHQRLCFALALWNGRDPILKERLFGVTGNQGNHAEDVKEYYFYLDSTPTHSYMKFLYKYPQRRVRVRALRILVEVLHVGVRRRAVEVEVVLLDVLGVVALVAGDAEQALLEDGVAAIPEGQREAEPLVIVRDAGQAVLTPAVGARARVLVGEVFPRRAPGTVVLPHGAPLPLGQIWTPAPPVRGPPRRFVQPPSLLRHRPPLRRVRLSY